MVKKSALAQGWGKRRDARTVLKISEDRLGYRLLADYDAIVVKFWNGKRNLPGLFFENVAANHAEEVTFAKVAVSKEETQKKFRLNTLPTFVMYKKGRETARLEGKTFYDALDIWTDVSKHE